MGVRPSINICITRLVAAGIPDVRRPQSGRRSTTLPRDSNAPLAVEILGHAGYFVAGMNQQADVDRARQRRLERRREHDVGHGPRARLAPPNARAASGHGGLLVIEGDASSRCGISLKGLDIVVGGSVGHMSAFMAQAGTLVVCGDAAHGLGDSLYEAVIYVRGTIEGLGTDAREEPLAGRYRQAVRSAVVARASAYDPRSFKRVASARSLYHWHIDRSHAY